jgi:hypothetical protein
MFSLISDCVAMHGDRCSVTPRANASEFPDHDTNTQAPPNEQAGTPVSEQPFAARPIDSMLNQQGNF